MRTLIVGAGGVGGNLAARLAAAYPREQKIWLLARGDSAMRIRQRGLELRHHGGIVIGYPTVIEQLSDLSGIELVVLAVKEPALDDILRELADTLVPGTCVLPLLNGLPRAAALSQRLPTARLFESCMYVTTRRMEPGIIEQQSPFCRVILQGVFQSADSAESRVSGLLGGSGVTCTISRSIAADIWTKYLLICPMAGVTSLYQRTFGQVLDDPITREFLIVAMTEIATLARACGIPLGPDVVARALATALSFPPAARTSMQRDFAEGRLTELEVFSGAALRLAQQHGLEMPAHTAIYETLQARTATQRSKCWADC